MIMTPYTRFSEDFCRVVNSEDFTNDKIKIFQLQTGGGKSYFQDKEMPIVLRNAFPNLKYIFRLSPTNEVANDGTFETVEELNGNCIFSYVSDPTENFLNAWKHVPNAVLCISCTHTYFSINIERLIKYAAQSVLCIEEAHQFIGCGDEGSNPYMKIFGYHTDYTASTMKKIDDWRKINGRVIGFTATPTMHHKGDETLSDKFQICNNLATLNEILPVQAWINETKEFPYVKNQGRNSIQNSIEESIDILFEREAKLFDLSKKDKNIIPKLSGLFIAGDRRGVWGCPIDEVRDIISNYLLSVGYCESEKMIATMVEDSSGGIGVYNLKGEFERIRESSELFDRLQDPEDPVRFLIVINRGRSGINVHNFNTCVVCRIRDPKEVRTPIPIQIFGRMVRINTGTGNIIRKKYSNNLIEYLDQYPHDYNVNVDTVINSIKIANIFDIWYPENPKAKRTWKDSLEEFKEIYVNLKDIGYDFLHEYTGIDKPAIESTCLKTLNKSLICPHCGESIEKKIEEWVADGTLNPFFNI